MCVTHHGFQLHFAVGLPARGRSICGELAWTALGERLPELVHRCVYFPSLVGAEVVKHVNSAEDQVSAHVFVCVSV